MTKPLFRKVVIFGVGLIGGSFALALRRMNAVEEVVGFGRSAQTLAQAQQLGIINRSGSDLAAELGDADLIVLATPVGQMADIMDRIAPHLGAHTLITDGGSTKCDVVDYAYTYLAAHISRFIPAHPIAGSEQSGAIAARADLYQNKKVILTPLPENAADNVARVRLAWELCGALVSELTPKQHDEVFAAVSHLPHLLSFALVHDLAQRENRDLLLSFAASGFRDFTRIAASSPEMWRDISLANRDALLIEMGRYMSELETLRNALAEADGNKLEEIFSIACSVRSNWIPQ
ncbi:Cyclohexadienyl dehydrogenase -specific [Candidatus Nitrotoga sp. HW29]|uniref:prephenate dehydrogenase n=1 Tax=Candidatus Nitrotoga sp. HW29 TaxID=2886963 RepID=UPI001EF1DF1E|nr:prephenate dehydrogenase/arogenate dehydrogenase family protein [Candidatus Nitrotoga sp. HW29]CAH1903502.1 Cyclohexadienyl dehydrogenase -specific [Candidatus Nitrotoga sp. HW29]